ncbi:MAG: transporter substrate-binding domain-containing protein [Lentisphaeraceae bacterium]|nr:transporter substrate-binding domain-containing protein [Lentisphaeraceae bacterium]
MRLHLLAFYLFSAFFCIFSLESQIKIPLTEKESEWLESHPEITMTGDPDWLPYESFNEKGEYIGIVSEHLAIIEKKLGIKIKKIPTKTWTESVEKAVSGEVDILSETTETELHKHLTFTQSYISNPIVIVMRNNENYVESISYLKKRKIGAIKDYGYMKQVFKKYPDIPFTSVANVEEGLLAVSKGEIDALVCTLAQGTFRIQKLGLFNVKIAGSTEFKISMAFGIRKEYQTLVDLFNKAIMDIQPEDQRKILSKWANLKYIQNTDYTLVIQITFLSLLIIGAGVLWNRKLRREIDLRKKIERDLKLAKEAAEAANQSKSTFLTNMSHEIRTPLNGIIGFCEILNKRETDAEKRRMITGVLSSGQSLLTLINDILDLAKVEAGRMELQYLPVNIKSTINELKVIFSHKLDSKKLQFICDVAEDVPDFLLMDEIRLKQILINLCGNSLKFTEKGFIKISVTAIETSSSNYDLKISVTDTGIGIAEDQCTSIFEAFKQSEGQKVSEFGGTGLGLSISKKLVEMFRGKISVDSTYRDGAKFDLYFPDLEVSLQQISKGAKIHQVRQCKFEPAKILIVDDIDYNREILRIFLEDYGFEIIEAANGKDALEKVQSEKPALIILDMKMPIMDGYETSARLKENSETKNIPVIAATASALKEDEQVISETCDYYIRKPVVESVLVDTLCRFIKFERVEEKRSDLPEVGQDDLIIKFLDKIESLELVDIICDLAKELEIKSLSELKMQLLELVEDINLPELNSWLAEYKIALDNFDMVKVEQTLNTFPNLINSIKRKFV